MVYVRSAYKLMYLKISYHIKEFYINLSQKTQLHLPQPKIYLFKAFYSYISTVTKFVALKVSYTTQKMDCLQGFPGKNVHNLANSVYRRYKRRAQQWTHSTWQKDST